MDATSERIWKRAREGLHTAVLGASGLEVPSSGPCVISIDCQLHRSPLGSVLAARHRVEGLLEGAPRPLMDSVSAGLRRRLLGEERVPGRGGALVVALRRLAELLQHSPVLLFRDVDAADEGSIELLAELLEHDAVLDASLVLVSRTREPSASLRKLLQALERSGGRDAVVVVGGAAHRPAVEPEPPVEREELPPVPYEVLRVLRAASLVGASFEAEVVADLLGLDPVDVMEMLQLAKDAGVPLADRGEGVFALDERQARALADQLLPSLASAWHRRLAMLLATSTPEPPPAEAPEARGGEPSAAAPAPAEARAGGEQDARAARHAEASGDRDLAARRYASAAREAANMGAYAQALALADRALSLIEALPASAPRRQLKIGLLAEVARVQWEAAGEAEPFSLPAALASVDACKQLFESGDPPELRAEVSALAAHICYDIGDDAALDRALRELQHAQQVLGRAGEELAAARLFNDEAAVWVRLGDERRAAELLRHSRAIFGRQAGDDPVAKLELAETDHLLARILLKLSEQDEPAVLGAALEHALAAEASYRALDAPRELARVWETLGRVERARLHAEEAAAYLTRAARAQLELRDVIGMARTSAALSELYADAGQWERALAALADSVELNLEKASPQGLEFNRASLSALARRMPPDAGRELADRMNALARRVEEGGRSMRRIAPAEARS